MRTSLRIVAASLVAALALVACGGGASVSSLPHGSTQQQVPAPTLPYSGPPQLANFTWGQSALQQAQAQYIGPITNGGIAMNVAVKLQNQAGLLQYAQEASNPHSPLYRRFLTPQEIGNRFGASLPNYQAVANYFASNGISVGGWPQRLQLSLAGTVQQFSKAFGTQFGLYRAGTTTFVAPMQAPHVTQPIPMTAVINMVQLPMNHTYLIRGSAADFGGYSPAMIGKIFDYSGAWANGLTGKGITIGIVGTGPISSKDVPAYGATFNAPVANVQQMNVTAQPASTQNNNTGTATFDGNPGGLATPPPVTNPNCAQGSPPDYNTCNPEDGEAQLDTEQTASLAPGAQVDFYLAYNPTMCVNTTTGAESPPPCASGSETYPLLGIQISDDEIQQAIADNVVDDLSLSYGLGENSALNYYFNSSGQGPGPAEFAALAAEGIAVFVSSGDTGNQSCFDPNTGAPLATPCVSYPASDPSVTAVGGVNAPANDAGNLIGQITAWADQTTGGGPGDFANDVGSGGGVSQYFTVPPWQNGVKTPTNSNPPSPQLNGYRGVPDVALMADPATGPALLMNAAFPGFKVLGASGGTSAAAPEMAAMWALVLQACSQTSTCATAGGAHPYRLGNAAPILYTIYGQGYAGETGNPSGFTPQLTYAQTFYDVLYGENQANTPGSGATPGPPITGCCTAGPGYDLVTGLGAPFAGHLIQAITGVATP
ncbi:MAG: S53 family peptidase [Vulcanimicrobiaceae bacterium]